MAGLASQELVLGLCGLSQPVDLDESQRGRGVILIPFLVGRQLMSVQAMLALAAHHLGMPFEELEPHRARDILLIRDSEGHQVLMELTEPETVIDQVGVGLAHERLEPERFLRKREELEFTMGLVEHDGRRGLVDLARLDADQAILDVVDPADAVLAPELVERTDQLDAVGLATVEGHGLAVIERDLHLLRLIGRAPRVHGPLERLRRRLDPGIFQDSGLDRPAPEVLIGAEDRFLGRLDLDAVLRGKLEFLRARPLPLADRGDDLQLRRKRLKGDVEADLVVPLSGAAVRNRRGTVLACNPYHELSDERPA